MKFYASLTGPLIGLYYPLPFIDENANRVAMNTSKLKGVWMSVYPHDEVVKQIANYGGQMLDDKYSRHLDYDSHEVMKVLPESEK